MGCNEAGYRGFNIKNHLTYAIPTINEWNKIKYKCDVTCDSGHVLYHAQYNKNVFCVKCVKKEEMFNWQHALNLLSLQMKQSHRKYNQFNGEKQKLFYVSSNCYKDQEVKSPKSRPSLVCNYVSFRMKTDTLMGVQQSRI